MSSEPTYPGIVDIRGNTVPLNHKAILRYPSRYRMLAYVAGKQAWAHQIPRNGCPYSESDETDHEARRKWLDGWDVAMAQSLVIDGDRRKTGERLTI